MHVTESSLAPQSDPTDEARRVMEICNACRYCEGYCAVFPAMELRREFTDADLNYLANLCHNCGSCYYACQYAPPHEFGINLPKVFAELRVESYKDYAWPHALAQLFHRNGTILSLAVAAGIAIVMGLAVLLVPPAALYGRHTEPGAFYAVIPWGVMVSVASLTFLFSLVALAFGALRFWRDTGGGSPLHPAAPAAPVALGRALGDILTLRNLGGDGGCDEKDESQPTARRWFHHAMFYGFLLCFAATSVATIYHHAFGWQAPYAIFSLPVQLGIFGGVGLMVGTSGLAWLKLTGEPGPMAPKVRGADFAMLMILWLSAATGLILLALRETPAMGMLLALHLGVILTLFLFLPYSKFVHGIYRSAALLRYALERGK